MKRAFLLLLVAGLAVGLGGCEMSPDDREFYGKGWLHPSDLDGERPTKMPAHPETAGSLGPGPTTGVSAREDAAARGSASTSGWTPDGY